MFSLNRARRVVPFGTNTGLKEPSRSRGMSKSTVPISVNTRLGVVPFLELAPLRPAGSPRS